MVPFHILRLKVFTYGVYVTADIFDVDKRLEAARASSAT